MFGYIAANTDANLSSLRDAIARLKTSSAHVCSLAGETGDDEQI